MSRLRVVITATAQAHVRAVVRWCVKNDRSVPETVLVELDGVIARIGEHPHSGHLYLQSPIDGVYRVLLRRSGYHVYFTVDENVGDVVVRAVCTPVAVRGRRWSEPSSNIGQCRFDSDRCYRE